MFNTTTLALSSIFLILGIIGFVPGITSNNLLLGAFHVNTVHNLFHILSAALGFWAASQGDRLAQIYCITVGIVYAVIGFLGLLYGDSPILGLVSNNQADTYLHFFIAVVVLVQSTVYFLVRRPTNI